MNLTDSPKKHGSYDPSVLFFFFIYLTFRKEYAYIPSSSSIFSDIRVSVRNSIDFAIVLYPPHRVHRSEGDEFAELLPTCSVFFKRPQPRNSERIRR